MRPQPSRLITVAIVVLIPSMLAPVFAASRSPGGTDALPAEAAVSGSLAEGAPPRSPATGGADHDRVSDQNGDALLPERARQAAPEAAAAETVSGPTQWLRSVSTAPMRPRLPARTAAPRTRKHLTWNARLRIDEPVPDALARTLATPGVRFATAAFYADVAVRTERVDTTLRVAFVDPGGFRVFTPSVTSEAEPLWHGVREGQVLLTHHTARRLGLGPGDKISLGGNPGIVVVGAASLGRAHVADVVVSAHRVDRRQFESSSLLLVGVQRLRELGRVAARLEAAGVGRVRGVADPQPYRAELTGDHGPTVAAIEPFTFVPTRQRGWIQVDRGWVKRNITRTEVPIIGEVVCHRLMIPQLRAALTEVVESGLASLIDPDDYGGCFAPRHIGRNPSSGLSMHAWGLAIDFNVHTNLMGRPPQLDTRIIEIFERHGFNWGGRWRTPDGMHFELGVLMGPPEASP